MNGQSFTSTAGMQGSPAAVQGHASDTVIPSSITQSGEDGKEKGKVSRRLQVAGTDTLYEVEEIIRASSCQ